MKPRLARAALAHADLKDIWSYVAADDPRAADALLDRLDRAARLLSERPLLGRLRPDCGVMIVRVVHGARDLTRLF